MSKVTQRERSEPRCKLIGIWMVLQVRIGWGTAEKRRGPRVEPRVKWTENSSHEGRIRDRCGGSNGRKYL